VDLPGSDQGLDVAIRKHVRVAGEQGWLDLQMIMALIVLNLAGGWRIWSGWSRMPALSR
jgi:hypothetical protein